MKNLFKSSNFEKYYKGVKPYFKKEKNQKYFVIILTLSTSIFFFLFAINPTLSTIAKLKKEISDSQLVEEKLSQKVNNLSSLSQEYQNIEDDIPYIIDAVPQTPEAPTLVGQIQALAAQSSVTITNVVILPVNLNARVSSQSSSFGFEITGRSNFENFQKFLSDLGNMQRALAINSINISKNTESGELEIIVKGLAYFKK